MIAEALFYALGALFVSAILIIIEIIILSNKSGKLNVPIAISIAISIVIICFFLTVITAFQKPNGKAETINLDSKQAITGQLVYQTKLFLYYVVEKNFIVKFYRVEKTLLLNNSEIEIGKVVTITPTKNGVSIKTSKQAE